ncbi:4705_t:CDS:1, partial [Dentiscutata erythropus]
DINFQGEGYNEAHNNFQEGTSSNIESHNEDNYESIQEDNKSIQEDSIQKDSSSHTENHEEV